MQCHLACIDINFWVQSCKSSQSPNREDVTIAGVSYSARLIKHTFHSFLHEVKYNLYVYSVVLKQYNIVHGQVSEVSSTYR